MSCIHRYIWFSLEYDQFSQSLIDNWPVLRREKAKTFFSRVVLWFAGLLKHECITNSCDLGTVRLTSHVDRASPTNSIKSNQEDV